MSSTESFTPAAAIATSTAPPARPMATRVVPYRHTCDTCGRAFQRATGLERHRRSAHSNERPYGCEYCPQMYTRTDLLQRHVSLYHKGAAAGKSRMQETIDTLLNNDAGHHQQQQQEQKQHHPHHSVYHDTYQHAPQQSMDDIHNHLGLSTLAKTSPQQQIDQSLYSWFYGAAQPPYASNEGSQQIIDAFPSFDASGTIDMPFANSADAAPTVSSSTTSSSPSSKSQSSASLPFSSSTSFNSSSRPNSLDSSRSAVMPLFPSPAESLSAATSTLSAVDVSPLLDLLDFDGTIMAPGLPVNDFAPLQQEHLALYRHHFAQHLPFVHFAALEARTRNELDGDLRRAMAIVGGNYGAPVVSADLEHVKSCDHYGCGALKSNVVRSIEEHSTEPSQEFLLRRTQTMLLLQLVAMFSESRKHRVAAALSHGTLIAVARQLMHDVDRDNNADDACLSWRGWSARQEVVRTLWAVFVVDSLQSFCYRRHPWLTLAELSQLPDVCTEESWNAASEGEWRQSLWRAPTTHDSIYDLVSGLKDEASAMLPAPLTLSGNLFVLASIVTEVMDAVQADTAARKQFAHRLRRADALAPVEREQKMRFLLQSLHTRDAQLSAHADTISRQLNRWLAFLHLSAAQTPEPSLSSRANLPFMRDFMPWYWAGIHFLGLLRGRVVVSSGESLAERLSAYGGGAGDIDEQPPTDDDKSLDVMHLLVRIRLALRSADGGTSMQTAVGSAHLVDALPPLPASVSVASITGCFPAVEQVY